MRQARLGLEIGMGIDIHGGSPCGWVGQLALRRAMAPHAFSARVRACDSRGGAKLSWTLGKWALRVFTMSGCAGWGAQATNLAVIR